MSQTVFSKTYKNGYFISVIVGGYGGKMAPFEVLVEYKNEPMVLNHNAGRLEPGDVASWQTFGDVQRIIDHLEALEKLT